MIRFIKRYALTYLPYYLLGLVALIITNYVATLIPLLIKDIVDLISTQQFDFQPVLKHLKSIVFLALILAVSRTFSRVLIFYPGRAIEYDLRRDLFEKLLSMPPAFYRKQKIGDLMSRMINDIQSLRATAALGYLHIINTSMIYSIVFFQMARIDLTLTILVILPIPIMMFSTRFFVKHLYRSIRACQERLGDLSNFFVESLSNISIIKSYAAESAILGQFNTKNDDYFKHNLRLARVRSSMFPFIGIIGNVGQLLLLLLGAPLILNASLSIGEFVALSAYIMMLSWPTASLAWIINIIQRGKSSWERIESIFHTKSDFIGSESLKTADTGLDISLNNLSFSYDKEPVLKDITLRIKPGESVGVFGGTASGKSSLLRIIAGLEHVQHMSVNNQNFSDIAIDLYRQHISYVSQEAFLFSLSILENISFDTTFNDAVERAAKRACVDADIQSFTEAYKTIVGEKGVVLSGGQKSRIALARAFYKPSKLLILDDVLSAVDHDTEKDMIHELFDKKQLNQSLVLSSHRISALLRCDVIYILDNGRIVESGTHSELLARSEVYKHTFEYQQMVEKEHG